MPPCSAKRTPPGCNVLRDPTFLGPGQYLSWLTVVIHHNPEQEPSAQNFGDTLQLLVEKVGKGLEEGHQRKRIMLCIVVMQQQEGKQFTQWKWMVKNRFLYEVQLPSSECLPTWTDVRQPNHTPRL